MELDALDIQSREWLEQFTALVEAVTHHAKDEEEAKIFPTAQDAVGEARAIELDAKLRVATMAAILAAIATGEPAAAAAPPLALEWHRRARRG